MRMLSLHPVVVVTLFPLEDYREFHVVINSQANTIARHVSSTNLPLVLHPNVRWTLHPRWNSSIPQFKDPKVIFSMP